MKVLLEKLLKPRSRDPLPGRKRLRLDAMPEAIYAIGDIHGCLRQLIDLEQMIADDAAGSEIGRAFVIYLGDLVDRGPQSAGVLDHLLAPSQRLERVVLCGNHDVMFLKFLSAPSLSAPWLEYGGRETLRSYGISVDGDIDRRQFQLQVSSFVPERHREFLEELPIALELPSYLFVHAGIDPTRPISEQADSDLLSIRDRFINSQVSLKKRIVHGHTPVAEVDILPHRIAVDTGAYGTGRLSAIKIPKEGDLRVIQTGGGRSNGL